MDTTERSKRLNPDERLMVMAKAITDHSLSVIENNAKESDKKLLGISHAVELEIDRRIRELEARFAAQLKQSLSRVEELFATLQKVLQSLPTPEVTVNIPPAKLISKDIAYNELGMPVKIIEREAKG